MSIKKRTEKQFSFYWINTYMKQYYTQKKNHSQQKSGPALSETFSSDVTHFIWGSPTDTHPALNESDTKVQNNSLSAKNNIKKYHNNDFKVNYNGSYEQIRVDLRRLLSLKKSGVSDYTIYITPKGRLAFRLTNHNAKGDNFSQDNADQNISVYVAYQEFIVPPSLIPYTEYRITKETFESDKQKCIEEIVKAVENAINTGDFYMSEDVATKKTYPEDNSEDKHENSNYNNMTMRNNNKALYESIMKDVAKVVKRRLNENSDIIYDIDDFIDEFIEQLCTPYAKFKTDISSNWGRYDNRYKKIQDQIYRVIIRVTDDADTHLILRTSFVINLSDSTFSDIDVEITDNPEDYNDRLERILTHNLYRDVSELLDYMVFKTA